MSYTVTVKHTQTILDVNGNQIETRTYSTSNTPDHLVRFDTIVAQSAAEASYIPPGFVGASISFLFLQTDQDILIRLVSAGTQIKVPAGKIFMLMGSGGAVNDILITGNASAPSNVRIVVGQ